jgi:exopolyphosphatase/guanosine-5'-triphosphate,3'-diphosphate pyrophosphatase
VKHADKVAAMASALFESLHPLHRLPVPLGRLLQAAAYLHDVGHFISDTRHHRHSYYVVVNSDLPGFTERERLMIANLCRYHRKAMPNASHDTYKLLTPEEQSQLTSMIPLLRLADSLDLSREQRVDNVKVRMDNGKVELELVSRGDVELEEWAARRVDPVFQEVYGHPLGVRTSSRENA